MFKSSRLALALVALCAVSQLQTNQVESCSKAVAKRKIEGFFKAFSDLKAEICGKNSTDPTTTVVPSSTVAPIRVTSATPMRKPESNPGFDVDLAGSLLDVIEGIEFATNGTSGVTKKTMKEPAKSTVSILKQSVDAMMRSTKIDDKSVERQKLRKIKRELDRYDGKKEDDEAVAILSKCQAIAAK